MKNIGALIVLISFTVASTAQEIHNFKKDSLQFKIYGNIMYESNKATEVKVAKVFCSYCNEKQMGYLSQVGWRNMYDSRNSEASKVKDGKTKKIIYIRVAKAEFRKLE